MEELLSELQAKARKFRGDETIVLSLEDRTINVVGVYSTWNKHQPFTATTDKGVTIASLSVYTEGPLEGLLWEKSGRSSHCGFGWEDELRIREALKGL